MLLTPDKKIVIVRKSSGFLGIGTNQRHETVGVGLHYPMFDFVERLEQIHSKAVAQEEKLDKRPNLDVRGQNFSIPSEMDSIKQQLMQLNSRVALTEQQVAQSYERGKEEGKQEIITYFKKQLLHCEFPQKDQLLMLLDSKLMEVSNASFAPPTPIMFAQPYSPAVKNEEEKEKLKAEKWIGKPKYSVIAKLVDLYFSPKILELEKIVAKWAIFELMLHKNDYTVATILENIQSQLLSKCRIHMRQLPSLDRLFSEHAEIEDAVTKSPLSQEEFTAFYQLTGKNALYLPQDGTATNCFGSNAARLKGTSNLLVTEVDYVKNVVDKCKPLEKAQTVFLNQL